MNKNSIIMNYPAKWWGAMWRDGLPSGNGEIGALVYGSIYNETIMLTHTDLWWKSLTLNMPDVSHKLKETRTLLFDNKPIEASKVLPNELTKLGYTPNLGSPLPLGDFKIIMPSKNAFKQYRRKLNMDTSEIEVSWLDGEIEYKRNLFVSRKDNIVVCKISSNKNIDIAATLNIERHDINDAKQYADNATLKHNDNLEEYLPKNCQTNYLDNYIMYSATNDNGTDFGAVAKIYSKNISNNSNGITASDNEILIIIKLFVNGDRKEKWSALRKELDNITLTYESLLERHVDLHKPLLNSSILNLYSKDLDKSNEEILLEAYRGEMPLTLVQKMWTYGRYLLISSSKENGNPCHLYGLWCGEYQGMWAFNMLNENVQMIYWHALSGNMPKLLLAVFDYYERLIDDFRENAKKLFGCRGIYIPAPTTPESGLLKLILPHILHWTGGAGWLAQHYYDYYQYTQDLDFLKNRAMPFMFEVALFYEDFFTIDENGYYISCPSNSPENTPSNYLSENNTDNMETTINATMDFAIAKELLTNLIEGATVTGLFKAQIEKWQSMLSRIPNYQINDDGAIKEWMHEYFLDNYHHRHESHIYPIFPGIEITKENNPMLFNAFVTAVKKRLIIGLKEQSGWSLAHMANNYARMGEGNLAFECLEIMSRSCVLNNLYTTHNDWRNMGIGVDMEHAPIQLDANMGLCSAINEMLLFSASSKISILPALPDKWPKGEVINLLARGGILVSIKWDLATKHIKVELISTKKDCTVDLIVPKFVVNKKKITNINLHLNIPNIINLEIE